MAERSRTWAIPWLISHNWTIGPYYSHYIWACWAIVACLIRPKERPSLQLQLLLNIQTFQERIAWRLFFLSFCFSRVEVNVIVMLYLNSILFGDNRIHKNMHVVWDITMNKWTINPTSYILHSKLLYLNFLFTLSRSPRAHYTSVKHVKTLSSGWTWLQAVRNWTWIQPGCVTRGVNSILNRSLCAWRIFSQDTNWVNSVLPWPQRH